MEWMMVLAARTAVKWEEAMPIGDGRLGVINLLPALPPSWPTGSVKGLRARGNFTADIEWKNGKVTSCRIAAKEKRPVKVRVNGELKAVVAERAR